MGIEDRLDGTRNWLEDVESEVERLKERVRLLEAVAFHLAKDRHDAAVEAGGFMRGHNIDFDVCGEAVCCTVKAP